MEFAEKVITNIMKLNVIKFLANLVGLYDCDIMLLKKRPQK